MSVFMSALVIVISMPLFHLILRECDMSFIHYATSAAIAERKELFAEAHKNWVDAARLARKEVNRRWAECRADYCLKSSVGHRVQANSQTI
ncbi:ANR family transcriptional regulator [Providencia huaxiensis]|nr:ANR family transcriptional regulator [Providencia huaxiensis]